MNEELKMFIENLEQMQTAAQDQFPDMDLYMDQMLSWIGGLEGLLPADDAEWKGLTAGMVNNYVKDGYIRRPVHRKYGRDQLIALYLILMLKPVLPIPLLAKNLRTLDLSGSQSALYERFVRERDDALSRTAARLGDEMTAHAGNPAELRLSALQMAAEAAALQAAAGKLLAAVTASGGEQA